MARDGPSNMAVDEVLLCRRVSDGPVLRVYRWDRPTLSYGYFIPFQEAAAACGSGESMVRRWTGGGLVHHADAFTWSLVVPATEPFCKVRAADSYCWIHGRLMVALGAVGFSGLQLVPQDSAAPSGGLCAVAPAPGDLLQHGKKIAGAGQRRTRAGFLHQGVIFLPGSSLPEDFPLILSEALAEVVSPSLPECEGPLPVERYSDPAWTTRR